MELHRLHRECSSEIQFLTERAGIRPDPGQFLETAVEKRKSYSHTMAETTGEDKKLLHIPMNINTKNKGNIQKGESTINTIIISKVIVINF